MFEPGPTPPSPVGQEAPDGQRTRRLVAVKGSSFGAQNTGNMVIQADNLAALDILRQDFLGKVRCAYLDPPYRNGERYAHYEDDLKHEEWLQQVTARVKIVFDFLTPDGSLWVSIDDTEVHYLKVALDRALGRGNFVTTIIWQQRTTRENRRVFSNNHEYVLVYARNPLLFAKNRHGLPLTEDVIDRYNQDDGDPRGPWQSVSANVQAGHAVSSQFYTIVGPNGTLHSPPNGRCWAYSESRMLDEIELGNISFGKDGAGVPRLKKFLSENRKGLTPETLWTAKEVGTNDHAKKHLHTMFPGETLFDTPKPEPLISRILRLATLPGDIVLDPYFGSGTTGAVSLKTGRKFIGIEAGAHASTVAAQRLKQVVNGETGGVSKEFAWAGGGGFDFFKIRN